MRNPGHLEPGPLGGGDILPGIMTFWPRAHKRAGDDWFWPHRLYKAFIGRSRKHAKSRLAFREGHFSKKDSVFRVFLKRFASCCRRRWKTGMLCLTWERSTLLGSISESNRWGFHSCVGKHSQWNIYNLILHLFSHGASLCVLFPCCQAEIKTVVVWTAFSISIRGDESKMFHCGSMPVELRAFEAILRVWQPPVRDLGKWGARSPTLDSLIKRLCDLKAESSETGQNQKHIALI